MLRGHAIEMMFDAVSERRILDLWRSICGGIDLAAIGARPHISLAVFRPPGDPDVLVECLETFAEHARAMQVDLASVGAFRGDGGVVFLAPTVSRELLDFHTTFHQILHARGVIADELYQPGRWVPHCTVALEVPSDEFDEAVDVVQKSSAFGPVTIEEINVVEFRPVQELFSLHLRGRIGRSAAVGRSERDSRDAPPAP